jgi:regulator of protease activity HflC (stomatin/prohibitin superfamily)
MMAGFYTIEPNFAVVILLFGKYIGTDRSEGFHWGKSILLKKETFTQNKQLRQSETEK